MSSESLEFMGAFLGGILFIYLILNLIKKRKISLNDLINNDPEIQNIDKELGVISDAFLPYLQKRYFEDPEFHNKMIESGLLSSNDVPLTNEMKSYWVKDLD
jgi:hypothetical protein